MRGLTKSSPGSSIECNLDLVLSNDITSPIAIKNFKQIGVEKVFDPTKIALVPDHYVPNKDIKSAEQAKQVRDFAREQGITHYYEVGCMGVEHALLPEQGVVGAGDLDDRRRFPYLHLWRPWRILHWRGFHRRRRGLCHGQGVVQGARKPAVQDSTASLPPASPARTSSCTSSA